VHLFGHRAPLFAPVAAIVSIEMTLGQRLRRAIEVILGAGVGALLISAIGTGPWQIAVVVTTATSVAVFVDGTSCWNATSSQRILTVTSSTLSGQNQNKEPAK
jgi:uncharacterized membrane protein YgaE (UPF0421/DUF939 family)